MNILKYLGQFVSWVNVLHQVPDEVSELTMHLQEWLEKDEEVLEVEAARKTLLEFIDETRRAIGLNDRIPPHIKRESLRQWIDTNASQRSYLNRELYDAQTLYNDLFPEPRTVVGGIEEFFERKAVKLH